jgi:predicted RNA-binding Zn-ribbon protein involved in translation (DUF1610 family)
MTLNTKLEVCYKRMVNGANDRLQLTSTRLTCDDMRVDYTNQNTTLLKCLDGETIVAIINSANLEWIRPFIPPTRRYKCTKKIKRCVLCNIGLSFPRGQTPETCPNCGSNITNKRRPE